MVLNDTISVVLKSNNCEICQQKITNSLIMKIYVLVDNYFCIHISHLLDFDTDDIVLFDTKYSYFDLMVTLQV